MQVKETYTVQMDAQEIRQRQRLLYRRLALQIHAGQNREKHSAANAKRQ